MQKEAWRLPDPLQGAIFDMDGTLLESMGVWEHVGVEFLQRRGITPPDTLIDDLSPLGMRGTAQYFQDKFGIPDTKAQIMAELNDIAGQWYEKSIPVKGDAGLFVKQLEEQGVRMCVATATDRHLAEAALKRLGLWDSFRFLQTCTEEQMDKDNPAFFDLALERLGVPKSGTVVFEDALHAVRTAKAAGFSVVAIADGSNKRQTAELQQAADRYIQLYQELMPAE